MLARPDGLADDDVRSAIAEHWSLEPSTLEYAAVGFGSHHWLSERHFVTVDEVADHDDLGAALRTAAALRDDAGLDFVHAALPSGDGRLLVPLGDEWVVHVYDRLEVVDDTLHGPHDDPDVLRLVHRIHDASPLVAHHAGTEDFAIGDRDDLEEALGELDDPWETGPFGDRCRELLRGCADAVRSALVTHDALVAGVPGDGWVVTHGEPHRGNVFRTTEGWKVVDWDTALVAPPERDWWDLAEGCTGDATRNDLYSLRWDLMEVACYVSELSDDHDDDANTRESWKNLVRYLGRLEARATRPA